MPSYTTTPNEAWTNERTAKLKELWAAGLSCAKVAAELGGFEGCLDGGRSAVIGKIHRLKLAKPDNKRVSSKNNRVRATPLSAEPSGRRPTHNTTRLQSIAQTKRNPTNSLAEKLKLAESDPGLSALPPGERPDGTGIQMIDLNDSNCHFPRGDVGAEDFEFCGRPALAGFPYCASHCRIAFTPASDRRRRPVHV